MTSELTKTLSLAVVSGLLLILAIISHPRTPNAPITVESGQEFYPAFKNTLDATSLEVVDVDEATATLRPFKVILRGPQYVIPSKFDHPADAKERLSKTAAALIDLKKGMVRTDNPKEHEALGVLDPLNAGQALKGLGTRVILRDKDERVLCDYILGKEVRDKKDTRFVRLPDQKRVYEVALGYQISSKFADWVETDLLVVQNDQIQKLTLHTYTLDLQQGSLLKEETNVVSKDSGGQWKLDGVKESEELNSETAWTMASGLDELKIIDVRKKPDGLSKRFMASEAELKFTRADLGTLAERGFYPGAKGVDLYSKEGELRVNCNDGVFYRIWFGEVVADADGGKDQNKDGRYIVIWTGMDETAFPEPPAPKDVHDDGKPKTDEEKKKDQDDYQAKKKERDGKLDTAKKRERQLAKRFADWYYVISGDSFKKLHKTRADLVKPKAAPLPTK